MKKIFEKINFRQPKYMLPAILYIPLLGASYFIFDLFHTETADIPDKTLQTTEFLNPELPEAQIKDDGIGSKYENMEKSWGKIQDYSAVGNIERDEPDENKEEYESQYTQDDIALLDEQQQEKAAAAEIAAAKEREQEALAELEKALAEARLKGQNMVMTSGRGGYHGHRSAAKCTGGRHHRRRETSGASTVGRRTAQRGSPQGEDHLGLFQHAGEGCP